MKLFRYIIQFFAAAFILSITIAGSIHTTPDYEFIRDKYINPPDTNPPDTTLPYPFNDNNGNPYDQNQNGGLYLNNPSNINSGVEYDPETNEYILNNTIGTFNYRQPNYMSLEEYRNYDMDKALREYWQDKTSANRTSRGDGNIIPKIHIKGKAFNKIFGGSTIDIRPSGSAELIFGVVSTKTNNPALDVKQRRTTNFDFQEKIQMNVTAKIGDKIQFGVNYNTESSFDFENKMNLKYEGEEDDIIQLIEGGDVTLPLNSTLIRGSQSLFGIKTKLKFGRASITGIWSQQQSQAENITVSGGAQTSDFDVKADQYEENRHYFLSQYFRDHYKEALQKLPIITSNINITNIEVWATTIGSATTENRDIVAFQDLGEGNSSEIHNPNVIPSPTGYYPSNNANSLLTTVQVANLRDAYNITAYLNSLGIGLTSGVDYEKVTLARKLQPSEYTFNSKLGFISLNTSLNSDQVLAVAYQYTLVGDTTVYKVGELTTSGITGCLVVKLLKSTTLSTKVPMYKLMMKNVYSIGGYQINPEDFRMNVLYTGEDQGVPMGYLTQGAVNGVPLIRVLGCDRLDLNQNPIPDGVFDFIGEAASQGGLIQQTNGRIFFPVLEPFGKDLRAAITGGNPALNTIADQYCYDSLYSMTKSGAQQYPDKNKFSLQGTYKSASGSEISLGAMNVPQGSVKVTAGGIPLSENVDYTVDYTMGRVKIINEGILNSGTPINISLENNSTFSIQTKTLMGLRVDYMINKNFNIGGTILNLTEKPLTQKVNYGDEPISNTIWGVDGNYTTEARWLTKLVDMIPLINTKAISNITMNAEFANLIPGHSKAIGKSGTTYIDDFESSKSTIDMKNVGSWFIASTPQGQPDMFPEAVSGSRLAFNYNRAKLAWYVIDPSVFYRNNNQLPPNITNDDISNHFAREVYEQEVFPNRQPENNLPSNISVLNMAFYPKERGPYNYDVDGTGGYSLGLNSDGTLVGPDSRWGGMMRRIESTDFEETNIEYIEFWMMDPFVYDNTAAGGQMYIDLGDVSEDVLRDSRKSVENGLPTTADTTGNIVDTTMWGWVPTMQPLTNSFDNNEDARPFQDVGLDGLSDDNENIFFSDYINDVLNHFGSGSSAYQNALVDPSGDDFHYFRGPDYDNEAKTILKRYKNFNGTDGNSPTDQQTQDEYGVNYPMQSTTLPDGEDINRDNTLSESERYFQYQIDLSPSKMVIGQNYIADILDATTGRLPNGTTSTIKWYQFKVPVQSPDKIIGGIQDFKSIRFIRVFFRGFSDSVICRFATFDLVRSDWRKYNYSLLSPGEYIPNDNQTLTNFDVSAVNLEENGQRSPVTYLVPPGIDREINYSSTTMQQLNEQSLSMKVCNLFDGDARAIYKTCDFDMRKFKTLKMFVHGEASVNESDLHDADLTVFIRLGSDFKNNYYEYEMPLVVTPWNNNDAEEIWPEANRMEITLNELIDAKKQRNTDLNASGSSVSLTLPYIIYDSKGNKVTIQGNPSISDVKVIMIGVRNPKKVSQSSSDDGKDKCAEIWINELRLTDFDRSGGYAATGRIAANLADFGNVSLAGTISTPGFGSLDSKLNELQKETSIAYDIATNLELGKFFPEKWGIKIPMHFDYSENRSIPEYNPINPDILYRDDIKTYSSPAARDSVRKITQDVTSTKSLNFMNVRKTKMGASTKSHIYDIENFDFTYAFTEIYHRDVDIEYNRKKTHTGGLGYNFSTNPKVVRPLDKWKLISKSKWLRILKDFNFSYMPKMLTFRTDMNKLFQENMMRNKTNAIIILDPTYTKRFEWTRNYGFKWDLTQNLKVEYQANAIALVDEPSGKIEKGQPNYKQNRDSIWENVWNGGRMTSYTQNTNINYTLPINKIPAFNWITLTARYGGTYAWTALPLSTDDFNNIIENPLGNTIENSNNEQLNLTGSLTNLYNKVKYLKKINDKRKGIGEKPLPKTNMPGDKADSTKPKVNIGKELLDNTLSLLMLVKTVTISYQEGNGRLLPGFMHKPVALGMDWNDMAPTFGFVMGSPGDMFGSTGNIIDRAFEHGWISTDTNLNTPFAVKQSKVLNYQASLEPINGMRIDVTGNTNYARQNQAFYRYIGQNQHSDPYSMVESGSFSMTVIGIKTAFKGDNKDNTNDIFDKFKQYRFIIAQRLAAQNPNSSNQIDPTTGFPDGYSASSQEVLIPAFLAAYLGKNPDKISLSPFSEKILSAIPLPNWRLTYNGLTKIGFIKKYFRTVTLNHSYRCTYNVNSFATNVLYKADDDGFSYVRDQIGNFLTDKQIGQISITEQFSPLIGFDMTMNNSLLLKLEWKKSRNLSLSFANDQLTDISTNEYVIGAGYRFKDVSFNLNLGGKRRHVQSDLNLKADFSIRQNKTTLRKLIENLDQVSAGGRIISINVSADYQISEKFNIRLFYDHIINKPYVSSQYPNSSINAGLSLRFTLAQ